MSPAEYEALRDEIAVSEACAPHIASRNTTAIAQTLSAGRVRPAPVPRHIFARWAAKTGIRSSIEDHANAAESPLRPIALTLLDVLRGAADSLDFSDEDNQQMLGAWVQVGAITAEQRDGLTALAVEPDPVSEYDVRCACWSDAGGWLL